MDPQPNPYPPTFTPNQPNNVIVSPPPQMNIWQRLLLWWQGLSKTVRLSAIIGTSVVVIGGATFGTWLVLRPHSQQVVTTGGKPGTSAPSTSPTTPGKTTTPESKKPDQPSPAKPAPTGGSNSNPTGGSSGGSGSNSGGSTGGSSGGGGGNNGGGGGGPAVCAALPSFPTTTCTGWQHTGVSLAVVHGIYYASTPGEVLDSKEFVDGVVVEADNVTIKRSKVEGSGSGPGAGIWVNQGVSGTLIEDVEVTSQPGFDPNNEATLVDRAITGFKTNGLTMRRVYAHKVIRGLQYGCNTLIEDSYIDDEVNPTGAHMSAIGGETCANITLTVRHNNIGLAPNVNDSAALLFYPPQVGAYGTQNLNITLQDNLIYGGTYCMWLSSDPNFVGSVSVTGNHFATTYYPDCGLYGTHFKDNWGSEGSASMTWSNNTQDGGQISF